MYSVSHIYLTFGFVTLMCDFVTVHLVIGRELSGPLSKRQVLNRQIFSKEQLLVRTLGHLSSVYCVLFDRTGRYIITVRTYRSTEIVCPKNMCAPLFFFQPMTREVGLSATVRLICPRE